MLVAQFQNILNWNELWEDFFLSIFYFQFSIFYYNSCFHKPSDISEKIRTKNCAARSATVWSEFSNVLLDKIQVCIHSSTLASFFFNNSSEEFLLPFQFPISLDNCSFFWGIFGLPSFTGLQFGYKIITLWESSTISLEASLVVPLSHSSCQLLYPDPPTLSPGYLEASLVVPLSLVLQQQAIRFGPERWNSFMEVVWSQFSGLGSMDGDAKIVLWIVKSNCFCCPLFCSTLRWKWHSGVIFPLSYYHIHISQVAAATPTRSTVLVYLADPLCFGKCLFFVSHKYRVTYWTSIKLILIN